MFRKLKRLIIKTSYWAPQENYLERIVESVRSRVQDDDIVVIAASLPQLHSKVAIPIIMSPGDNTFTNFFTLNIYAFGVITIV